ncbi:hypothetical protein H0H93_014496 [Arthromyces matolae]|nr:hypothetical protein H0H93_014496 [Arthromyces matolae]
MKALRVNKEIDSGGSKAPESLPKYKDPVKEQEKTREKTWLAKELPFERVPAINREPVERRRQANPSVIEKLLSASVSLETRELLSLPGVRDAVERALDKNVPSPAKVPTKVMVQQQPELKESIETKSIVNVADLPMPSYYVSDGSQEGVPKGALVMQDCVASYLEKMPANEKPEFVYIARDMQVLRSLYPIVNGNKHVEAILDSGSQIICMALDKAQQAGLTWDPDITLRMESANKQVNLSVGLAKNVPFKFGDGFTVYLQVHIFVEPAYPILLGRPFDTVTESNIQNLKNGSAIITLRDPNTGKRLALTTFERGKIDEPPDSQENGSASRTQ